MTESKKCDIYICSTVRYTIINANFNNTCKLTSSPKYVLFWMSLIMIRKNFSLCMYITSVVILYTVIVAVKSVHIFETGQ